MMLPRLSLQAIETFDKIVPPNTYGFEWGSGTGTIWLAQRSKRLVSIEHDLVWAEKVDGWLSQNNLREKVDYRIRTLDDICHRPKHCFYKGIIERAYCFRSYVNVIDEFDIEFDYILVDGRARVGCLFLAMSKLKPGGILILDNSERVNKYGIAIDALRWPVVKADGLVDGIYCETKFWIKPNIIGE